MTFENLAKEVFELKNYILQNGRREGDSVETLEVVKELKKENRQLRNELLEKEKFIDALLDKVVELNLDSATPEKGKQTNYHNIDDKFVNTRSGKNGNKSKHVMILLVMLVTQDYPSPDFQRFYHMTALFSPSPRIECPVN